LHVLLFFLWWLKLWLAIKTQISTIELLCIYRVTAPSCLRTLAACIPPNTVATSLKMFSDAHVFSLELHTFSLLCVMTETVIVQQISTTELL
jgi:hypothetical protein